MTRLIILQYFNLFLVFPNLIYKSIKESFIPLIKNQKLKQLLNQDLLAFHNNIKNGFTWCLA